MKAAAVGHKPPSERSIWQNDCRSVGEDDFAKLWLPYYRNCRIWHDAL